MAGSPGKQAPFSPAAYSLSRLTFREVEGELGRLPALVAPFGGCEPYGEFGALGVAALCAKAVASALASKLRIILAPTLAYGCSTAAKAFGGSAGVKPRTLTNIVCETFRMWYFQGFRIFIIIDSLADNHEAIGCALRRLARSNPDLKAVMFSLQHDERIREFIGKHQPGRELGRSEFGLLSMAAFIDASLVRGPDADPSDVFVPELERFQTWRKRGADPQQYRKLFPHASSSTIAGRFNAEFGRELFAFILQLLEETVAPLVTSLHPYKPVSEQGESRQYH